MKNGYPGLPVPLMLALKPTACALVQGLTPCEQTGPSDTVAPGGSAMPRVGSGTIAGMGVPTAISPSGSAREFGIGCPVLALSGVPDSKTSCTRHMLHMPAAKCG